MRVTYRIGDIDDIDNVYRADGMDDVYHYIDHIDNI